MNLLQEAFESDPRKQANQILVQGRMGSGKTTLLRAYADQAIRKGHCVIWRTRPRNDQWHLMEGKRKILVPQGSRIEFSQEINDELHEYSGPADIVRKLQKGLNVIIEPQMTKPWDALFWTATWNFLQTRKRFEWVTIVFDEVKDVFPSQSYGPYYFIMPQMSSVFRDSRRANLEMMFTIHEARDIHWDWVGKFQAYIYMHGSDPIRGKRVKRGLLQHLEPGHVIVELRDNFADVSLRIPDSQYPKSLISYDLWNPEDYHELMDKRTQDYIHQILPKDIIAEIYGQSKKKNKKTKAPKVEIEEIP